jgi:hypothetical protein
MTYPRLCDKYRDQINAETKKEREMVKEIDTVLRKQIEDGDKLVRELIQIIQTDLSVKLKGAIVKISV